MNFDLGDREKAVREGIQSMWDPDSAQVLSRLERGDIHEIHDHLRRWMERLGKTGYLDLGLEDGKNSVELVACQEALAEVSPSLFLSVEASVRIFGRLIAVYADPEQKAEILPAVKEGSIIGAVALSEQGMSLEGHPLMTTGTPEDGGFRLSGSKGHVVNGPIADILAAVGKLKEGTAFFLLPKGTQGLFMGQRLSTVGFTGAPISPVSFEGCPVPAGHVIGPLEGNEPIRRLRSWEDQILTAAGLGLMKRCFENALDHAKSHESGGKPIIAYQEISFKLAEMLTLLQTARLLAYRAAWMDQVGHREAAILAGSAKVFCAESAEQVASHAMQILGQHGYLRGNVTEEGYRDAKYLQIAGTSSEIARMKIGDEVLEKN